MNEPMQKTSSTRRHRGSARFLAMLGALLFIGISLYASRESANAVVDDDKSKTPTDRAVAAANSFLDALYAEQREKALYVFDSDRKPRWSNLPVSAVPRNGVRLGDLTKVQREKAMAVVAAVLSANGYQKIVDIMDGDQQLAQGKGGKGKGPKGGGKGGMFGSALYYLAIFGKPSTTQPWMVQFGGHHLGINVSVIGKHFVLTPSHTGAQPALFTRNGKDVRPLGLENDAAFKLINALDEKQQAQAIIGKRPRQLVLGPGQDGKKIEPQGIKGSALSADQQAMLLDVIAAWVNIVETDAAKSRMAEIKDKIAETYFAWSGPTDKGSAAYFRVQGPAVVIEYAPQSGTDHIHTVIRNPKDDYGAGLLKR